MPGTLAGRREIRGAGMILTVEKDPETIKRYAHIRPARVWAATCSAALSGTSRSCSRERGHRGPHVAHGLMGKAVAVWDAESSADSGSRGTVVERRRRAGPRVRRDDSLRRPTLWSRMEALLSNSSWIEEAFLLVLFVGFVVACIDWVLRMLG